jgi:hypothetical protein
MHRRHFLTRRIVGFGASIQGQIVHRRPPQISAGSIIDRIAEE